MKEKPHTAILYIKVDVHPINAMGECDGRTVSKKTTGLDNRLLAIKGTSLQDCIEKTKEVLDEISNLPKL